MSLDNGVSCWEWRSTRALTPSHHQAIQDYLPHLLAVIQSTENDSLLTKGEPGEEAKEEKGRKVECGVWKRRQRFYLLPSPNEHAQPLPLDHLRWYEPPTDTKSSAIPSPIHD